MSWTIVDANETALNLHAVPINSLINSAFNIKGECSQVLQLSVWNNGLVVHCKVNDGNTTECRLLIGRMKEDPKREHFLSQQRFQELFNQTNHIQPVCLNGSITALYSPVFPDHQYAASILGIQKILTETRHHRRRFRLVCIDLRN
ncbi:unnamed protein product [Allacma fusca]|uniref:Uncharacterized protein n=1 Tax=Allacma fusca TaxID=39272 RepID=A0A8J2L1B2_9HEXA|nr:unnamed protein product [Allacma fusca]